MLQGMAQVIKDGDAEEVMKQIAALRDQLEGKSRTAVDIARSISFTITRAAYGQANPSELAAAKQIHFALFGTPEIDLAQFGPKHHKPTVCIDGGKPNQLVLDADAIAWGY
jgi:hypothetical protein